MLAYVFCTLKFIVLIKAGELMGTLVFSLVNHRDALNLRVSGSDMRVMMIGYEPPRGLLTSWLLDI